MLTEGKAGVGPGWARIARSGLGRDFSLVPQKISMTTTFPGLFPETAQVWLRIESLPPTWGAVQIGQQITGEMAIKGNKQRTSS